MLACWRVVSSSNGCTVVLSRTNVHDGGREFSFGRKSMGMTSVSAIVLFFGTLNERVQTSVRTVHARFNGLTVTGVEGRPGGVPHGVPELTRRSPGHNSFSRNLMTSFLYRGIFQIVEVHYAVSMIRLLVQSVYVRYKLQGFMTGFGCSGWTCRRWRSLD